MKQDTREVEIQSKVITRMLDSRKARLADRETQIASIRAEMTIDEAVVAQLEDELAMLQSSPGLAETNGAASTERLFPTPSSGTLAEKIEQILRDNKKPMRAWEIGKRLKEMGVTSESPKGVLPAVFAVFKRRTGLFRRVGRGTYALVEDDRQGG